MRERSDGKGGKGGCAGSEGGKELMEREEAQSERRKK